MGTDFEHPNTSHVFGCSKSVPVRPDVGYIHNRGLFALEATTKMGSVTPDDMERTFDRIQEIEWSFAHLVILHAAADTGLLGWLAEQDAAHRPEEIAGALGLHPQATEKILRALGGMDLLESGPDGFRMHPGAAPLFEPGSELDHTVGLAHLFRLSRSWGEHLPGWLRTGQWPRPTRSAQGVADFVGAMRSLAQGVAGRLDAALDLDGVRDLSDIGGALGTYSLELCLRHPGLQATVLDRPEVIPLTREEIARYELEDRVHAQAGSYLEPPYPEADLVLLANVLHQEAPESAARMVRFAAEATRPGGRVAVVEFTLEDDRCHPLSGAVFAINMRLSGETYSEAELRRFLQDAGLEDLRRTDLSPSKFLITGRKPA